MSAHSSTPRRARTDSRLSTGRHLSTHSHRATGSRPSTGARLFIGGVAVAALVGACGSSSHRALPAPTTTSTTTTTLPAATTTTTLPELGATGPRTVLSPVGLNVRAQPSTSGKILATAAEGAVLTVVAHSSLGWFHVKGATVTGWITDNSTLSAPGRFASYTSSVDHFTALYPSGWTVATSPPATVVFRPPASSDSVVVTGATTAAALPKAPAGYHQTRTQQELVCGVTSQLVTYSGPAAPATATTAAASHAVVARPYLAKIDLTLNATHALALNANITSLSQLQTVLNFTNALTFPFSPCLR